METPALCLVAKYHHQVYSSSVSESHVLRPGILIIVFIYSFIHLLIYLFYFTFLQHLIYHKLKV